MRMVKKAHSAHPKDKRTTRRTHVGARNISATNNIRCDLTYMPRTVMHYKL